MKEMISRRSFLRVMGLGFGAAMLTACKTGTAQWQGTTSTGSFSGSDHASFVLYAPADNPEIAISVYVERGSQGGNLANVCIPILDAYFSSSAKYETVATENIAY